MSIFQPPCPSQSWAVLSAQLLLLSAGRGGRQSIPTVGPGFGLYWGILGDVQTPQTPGFGRGGVCLLQLPGNSPPEIVPLPWGQAGFGGTAWQSLAQGVKPCWGSDLHFLPSQ